MSNKLIKSKAEEEEKLFSTKILLQPLVDALGVKMEYQNGLLKFVDNHEFGITFDNGLLPIPFRMNEVFHHVNLEDAYTTILAPVSGDVYLAGIHGEEKDTVWIYLLDAKKFSLRLNNMGSTIPRFYIQNMMARYTTFSKFQEKLGDSIIATFRKGIGEHKWYSSNHP